MSRVPRDCHERELARRRRRERETPRENATASAIPATVNVVADETRPPVAIRSLRPYSTEDAFLAEERDTLTRTAITLIGAPSRPRGVVIRFEVTLSDGVAILRGEGRVLGFVAADAQGPSSLTLRFTKLDAKSKALVDRAAEMRDAATARGSVTELHTFEARSDTEPPPALPPTGAGEDAATSDPLAATSMGYSMPHPSDFPPASGEAIALAISSGSLPLGEVEEIGVLSTQGSAFFAAATRTSIPPANLPPGTIPPSASVPPVSASPSIPAPRPVSVPAPAPVPEAGTPVVTSAAPAGSDDASRRDGLLDRLRVRAKTLSPTQVATILAVPRIPT